MKKLGGNLKYRPEFCGMVDAYLEQSKDERVLVHKQRTGETDTHETKLTVKLPTIEGFARFLGFTANCLEKWGDRFPKFKVALRRVIDEQKKRLLNAGLSGDYNSTIAKLILSSNHGMREGTDITTAGQPLPTPIYGGKSVQLS